MYSFGRFSRRKFIQTASLAAAGGLVSGPRFALGQSSRPGTLQEFSYADVILHSDFHERQLGETHSTLMELSEDGLLKPFREMAGQPAPGEDLGGWYSYDPNFDWHGGEVGFAPGATFGQWISALARSYATDGSPVTREKILRLNRMYAKAISGGFFEKQRFPAYSYDKLVCGLIDSHQFAHDPHALAILDETTRIALPHLPKTAIERLRPWRPGTDDSYTWDESYTMSENLFLAYQRGAGERYRELAVQYLDDEYYDPLARGLNNLAGRHAYSYVNSLCSAMQAYLTVGNEKHLRAARNGFDFVSAQSFATGGWGPDEALPAPRSSDVFESLTKTHNSFETPCGSYAHFKLARYLLRVTRDPRYGDSMERMMYNTVLGAKPLQADGRAFYYSDYNFAARKVYSTHRWPCCSGTLPQVAADYRINTYFRDAAGVYVNLYIPSTLRWYQNGAQIELTQRGGYPHEGQVEFEVKVSRPAEFAVNLRIPAWGEKTLIAVNGKRHPAVAGTFAHVQKKWKTGDRVELEMGSSLRLEALDAAHPNVAALMSGPLVLFAITDGEPKLTRAQLLAAKRNGAQTWEVAMDSGSLKMLPFTAISDEQYSTYLRIG